jgi:hypothetical protein
MDVLPIRAILEIQRNLEGLMRNLRQFVVALAILIALPAPVAMSCFAAGLSGVSAKHACCEKMAITCGMDKESASPGCCIKRTVSDQAQSIPPRQFRFDFAKVAASIQLFALDMNLPSVFRPAVWSEDHPPGTHSSATAPLRI